jgi:hypothetical protein
MRKIATKWFPEQTKLHEWLPILLNYFKGHNKFKGSETWTDGPEDGAKLLIQTNPLKSVHIVDTRTNSRQQRESYFSISSVVWMEMSSPSVAAGTSSCARWWLDLAVPCGDATKDEYHGESCNPLSPEHEPEPRLDRASPTLLLLKRNLYKWRTTRRVWCVWILPWGSLYRCRGELPPT